ncbi:putative G3BP-like protein [Senna tora]|uniref:Putative G3BP-like protein n=1 Tax=Senna tora TaxID=362788 RepID=A0A835CH57_9FABA|nr:putative G3BP-like protein [Senna tora]
MESPITEQGEDLIADFWVAEEHSPCDDGFPSPNYGHNGNIDDILEDFAEELHKDSEDVIDPMDIEEPPSYQIQCGVGPLSKLNPTETSSIKNQENDEQKSKEKHQSKEGLVVELEFNSSRDKVLTQLNLPIRTINMLNDGLRGKLNWEVSQVQLKVAKAFIDRYYNVEKDDLHEFYKDTSQMTRDDGRVSLSASGKKAIQQVLGRWPNFRVLQLTTVGVLSADDGAVVKMRVRGYVDIQNVGTRMFDQTLVLAADQSAATGFYVRCDAFYVLSLSDFRVFNTPRLQTENKMRSAEVVEINLDLNRSYYSTLQIQPHHLSLQERAISDCILYFPLLFILLCLLLHFPLFFI